MKDYIYKAFLFYYVVVHGLETKLQTKENINTAVVNVTLGMGFNLESSLHFEWPDPYNNLWNNI